MSPPKDYQLFLLKEIVVFINLKSKLSRINFAFSRVIHSGMIKEMRQTKNNLLRM